MGDMKTPDFDDLLAAFDIPDIESIHSSPEVDNVAVNDTDPSPAPFRNDPSAVSVIVKNTTESCENEPTMVKDDSKGNILSNSDIKAETFLSLDHVDSPTGAKLHTDNSEAPFAANGFEGSSSDPAQSEHLPFKSLSENSDGHCKQVDQSPQLTTDVIKHFKHLYPKNSTDFSPISPVPSPSPQRSPPSPKREEAHLPDDLPSAAASDGSSAKPVSKDVAHYEDDDSEPDFGSPLVIQESPDFVMASPKRRRHRRRFSSETENVSSVSQPSQMSLPCEDKVTTPSLPPPAPSPQSPQNTASVANTGSVIPQAEKYPEHVIDERDSPESPPPSETGMIPPRSTSPELAATTDLSMDHMSPDHQDKPMDDRPSDVEVSNAAKELTENIVQLSEVNKEDGATETREATPTSSAVLDTTHVLPLKVKIKVPMGSLTKSGASTVSKKTGKNTCKAAGGSKSLPPDDSRLRSELTHHLSPAVLQDAATLNGHNTAQDKGLPTKPPVSSTAVIITRSAALPTVSAASCRVSGLNLLSQKALNNGTTSARPASIVNTTGATISKNQTNLVESFNKILNTKNLLPSYKADLTAPPAEWGLPLPAQGYRCLECGDSFALEQSLAHHYDRRSLRIEVTCNHCAKRLVFFNKCSLLLHAREHKEKGLVMQCSHLVMRPVPVEQMISQHGPATKGQSAANTTKPLHSVSTKSSESLQYINNKCSECQLQFSSREEVVQHFQEVQPSQNTACAECSPPMLLPNSCSAAAHQRVHQRSAPFVCPECGGTAKQETLQKHLDETCLHFSRRIGYRCSSCLVVFGGLNSVKSHIQQAHCDTFHKCPSCPMAFKSAPSTLSHITAQHPTLTGAQAMLIYKCVMCDTVFTQTSVLSVHFETHLTNQQVHVFKCPECTKLFSQRSSLLDHFKMHQAATQDSEPSSSPLQPTTFSSAEEEPMDQDAEEEKSEKVKAPSGWKCAPCQTRFSDRQDFIEHMAKEHSKILKKFPCNKCDSSFTTTSSMRRHIRDKHKVVNRVFRCQFCTEGKKTFSSRALLDRHVQLRHSGETQDGKADSSSAKSAGLRARRRRRRDVKVDQAEESSDAASPDKKPRPASSSQPESGFRCAPCGFTTEDQPAFLEHISQHLQAAPEGSSQQCLQCGACFTSTSSLARHQFITHKVKDAAADQMSGGRIAASLVNSRGVDELSSQGGSAPASPSSQGKGEEDKHACKVCKKRFEKPSDLNTHFRTHGMAFISARNSGKST
ncbi:zinc finger protein 687a [Synchiropus splendidus]|uniref:zinc finger protein 687a n=1 Tax=Synchiropus splendidus TaxID=270530 RepID=UPI00237D3C9C|nr:zinc finger protein 687a [Synchiropus splendidus]